MKMPTVAIVGRTNTGKSTLFNRLTESKKALVSELPGTTRDRNISEVNWRGLAMRLIDTGGIDVEGVKNSILLLQKKILGDTIKTELLEENILFQASRAISDADIILLLVDGKTGILKQDRELARMLKTLRKTMVCAVNKIDSVKEIGNANVFYRLGLGDPVPVSAANGSGTGDLLDILVLKLKKLHSQKDAQDKTSEKKIYVSLIGKPNVGKSSLLNSITGEERVIVSPIPMTTREPQDTEIIYKKQTIVLVDTAGIKKKAKTAPGLDAISSMKSLETLQKSDIVLFVLDAHEPLAVQDLRLAGTLHESLAGVIIVANKWDLVQLKSAKSDSQYFASATQYLAPVSWAPCILVSAKTGKNIKKILDLILEVFERRNIRIPDKTLNTFLKKLVRVKRPIGGSKEKRPKIIKIRQPKTNPPEFLIYLGNEEDLHFSYYRFIENSLRKIYGLEGVNLKITAVYP